MTTTATNLLNVCRSQLGYREGRNNDNKYGLWYGLNHEPYCAIGLSWAGYMAGASDILLGRFAYCPYWEDAWKHASRWHAYTEQAQPGDIVFFDWSGQHGQAAHVGIVERVDGSTLVTIEFNTSSGAEGSQSDGQGVWRRRRSPYYVVGYGRPNYARQAPPVPAPVTPGKPPIPLVVDGVWGPMTTGRLQLWLGLAPSGTITTATRTALQHRLHVAADGIWGPRTRVALQGYLRVTQDGVWGPVTVRALQRMLNGLGT